MLLNLLLVLVIAGIVYFHYTQGLFAATVSAFCAGVAALMAFSYHETIVAAFTGGALAAYGNAVMLCGLFALIYLVLRIVIDNFLPGNVRYPVLMDRIGAAVMGIFAAFFASAIVVIGAQELPFGPAVAWYSPYPLETTEYSVPRDLSQAYRVAPGDPAFQHDQVQVARLESSAERQELWIPVDSWFIGLVAMLSDNGSLAGTNRFGDIYPDFKTAIYGHGLGMQRSAKQMALNIAGQNQVSVSAVFRVITDGEGAQFPGGVLQVPGDIDGRKADPNLLPGAGKTLLVLRIKFGAGSADSGGFVRFSPGAARLVVAGKQYYPIATLESGTVAVVARPDDALLSAKGVDFVYEVDTASAISESELAEPAFLEFKRFARVDLAGARIFNVVTKSPDTHLPRKVAAIRQISARLANRNIFDGNARDEFMRLRAEVPEVEADPATAEGLEQPPADQGEGGSIDRLRQEADRRNEALQGDQP